MESHNGDFATIAMFLVTLACVVLLPFIPANVGKKKGYSFGLFYAFGFFAFVPALVASLVVRRRQANASELALAENEEKK